MVFSKSKLDEIKFVTETLDYNSFPLDLLQSVIRTKISNFNKIKSASVQKYPAYLRLPWLGNTSNSFAK